MKLNFKFGNIRQKAERSKSHAVPISRARFSGPERNPKA